MPHPHDEFITFIAQLDINPRVSRYELNQVKWRQEFDKYPSCIRIYGLIRIDTMLDSRVFSRTLQLHRKPKVAFLNPIKSYKCWNCLLPVFRYFYKTSRPRVVTFETKTPLKPHLSASLPE